jgi:hypothetical protein
MTKEQTPEADAFLARVVALPAGADADALDGVLAPAIADETALRRLWASDRSHVRLANPHVGLVDVFAAPAAVRTTYARSGDEVADAQHVMPVRSDQRRSSGEPCMSVDMAEFMSNFKIFTGARRPRSYLLIGLTPVQRAASASSTGRTWSARVGLCSHVYSPYQRRPRRRNELCASTFTRAHSRRRTSTSFSGVCLRSRPR